MSERLTNKKIKAAAAAAGKEVFHCAYETTRVLRVLRELEAAATATSHQLSPSFCVPSASSLPANSAAPLVRIDRHTDKATVLIY